MGFLSGAEVATLITFIDGRLRLPEDLSVWPFARLKRYIEKLMVTSPALAPRIVTAWYCRRHHEREGPSSTIPRRPWPQWIFPLPWPLIPPRSGPRSHPGDQRACVELVAGPRRREYLDDVIVSGEWSL